jgi:hypothetical protein
MLLTLIIDTLGAVGLGRGLESIAGLLVTSGLLLGVIVYLLVQLASQRLAEQQDPEWTMQKAAAAIDKRQYLWFMLVLCSMFLLIIWWGLLAK